jgi:hypothetical protein
MNHRRFLTLTALCAAVLLGRGGSARAFTVHVCGPEEEGRICDQITSHKLLLADLKAELEKQHLSPTQEHAVFSILIGPFWMLLG